MMSPVPAAVAGALISGVAMYTIGARTERVNAFSRPAPVEYVQTVDGRYVAVTPAQPAGYPAAQPVAPAAYPVAQPASYSTGLRPAGTVAQAPVVVERPVIVERPAARQTVYRASAPAQTRVQERVVVEREPVRQGRSWQKTALVIGGSAASGAAVGGIVDGKKGALIGAALGGGAASIYEAVKR